MKYLFIEPVSYLFVQTPVVGIPSLMGILESLGQDAQYMDFNNEFILKAIRQSGSVSKPELAVKILKNKKLFFYKFLCEYAINVISVFLLELRRNDYNFVCNLIPNIAAYRSYEDNCNFAIDVNVLKNYFESNNSLLNDYYDKKIDEILQQNPDYIGITIGIYTQLVPGLMLAYKLKKRTKVHINIGGSFFNDFYKNINNLPELFSEFFDSVSLGDSTVTIADFVKYLKNEISIEEVDNLMYFKDNKVIVNVQRKKPAYSSLPVPSFAGYNFDNYLFPERMLPIKASNNCYWGKCIFCHCSGGEPFQIKSEEQIVEELIYLSQKYNTKFFYFWDESIPPAFISKLCDLILAKKLKLKFSLYARFENAFDYKLLKKMRKAGCGVIHWGLDSASSRVLDFINKGIKLEKVPAILNNAQKAGIYNLIYLLLGHPSETIDDIEQSMNFIKKHIKKIHQLVVVEQVFFINNSIIYQNKDYYKSLIKTTLEERIAYVEKLKKIVKNNYYNLDEAPGVCRQLYAFKYGIGIKARLLLPAYLIMEKLLFKRKLNFFRRFFK